MRRLLVLSLLFTGVLSGGAIAQAQSQDCEAVYDATLRQHGVSNGFARRRVVLNLLFAKQRDHLPSSVESRARQAADRVSNDQDWINWAAWVAAEAYRQDCALTPEQG